MSAPPTRRFTIWYGLFLVAAVLGVSILTLALDRGERDTAMVLVFLGLGFAVVLGVLAVIRLLRGGRP